MTSRVSQSRKFPLFRLSVFLGIILTHSLYSGSLEELTIARAFQLAKLQNPSLLAERYNLEIAKADVTTAKLFPNPVFNNQELIRPSGPGNSFSQSNRQDWFQVTMPIPVAGQREYSIELAIKNLSLAQNNLIEFQRNLLYVVGTKWLEVWIVRQRTLNILRAKHNSDELLSVNELRLKNEVITKSEFLRTQIINEQYEADLYVAEQQLRNQIQIFNTLLGKTGQLDILADGSFPMENFNEDLENLNQISLALRGDILASNAAVSAAATNIKLQEANAYPRPEVGIIYNPQNTERYYGSFVTIRVPIFDRNQGEIEKSISQFNQLQQSRTALELNIKTEVKNALGEFNASRKNFEKYKKIFESSEKVLETVKYSYLRGGTTVIDYLDAQRNWFQTLNLYYDSIFQFRRTYLQILFVTGKIVEY